MHVQATQAQNERNGFSSGVLVLNNALWNTRLAVKLHTYTSTRVASVSLCRMRPLVAQNATRRPSQRRPSPRYLQAQASLSGPILHHLVLHFPQRLHFQTAPCPEASIRPLVNSSPGRGRSPIPSWVKPTAVSAILTCRPPSTVDRNALSRGAPCAFGSNAASISTACLLAKALTFALGLIVRIIIPFNLPILRSEMSQKVRDLTLAFDQDFDQILSQFLVTFVVKRRREALVANASSAANAMNIFIDAAGKVSSDLHGVLTLTLVAIRVDRCRRHSTVVQKVIDEIDLRLRVAEHHGAAWLHLDQEVVQTLALLILIDIENVLTDVLVSRAGATETDTENMRYTWSASSFVSAVASATLNQEQKEMKHLVGLVENRVPESVSMLTVQNLEEALT
ncbi:hypothetical protein KC333_g75 [Hortaea werneckii]|nr:hypothetical protein KC333_g75 [Hortaea werneckii]